MFKTTGRTLRECPPGAFLDAVRSQGSHYAPLESIPAEVLEILVTREDPGFYRHKGVLPKQMLRAFKYGIREHVPMPGGSTITQQLMKNLYFSCERSVVRKLREAAHALSVEYSSMLTKDEILELYLNIVRYGPDVYGIADAAEYYFGQTAVLGLLNHLRWDWQDEYESTDYLEDLGKRVFDDAGLPEEKEFTEGQKGYRPIPGNISELGKNPLVSYTALSANCSGRRGKPVTRITPHYAAGDPTVEMLGLVFADGAREASANYGIGSDGRIGMYVEESRRSWASGSPENDERAVTIECANLPDGSLRPNVPDHGCQSSLNVCHARSTP